MLFMWMNPKSAPGCWIYMGEITSITEAGMTTTAPGLEGVCWPNNYGKRLIVGPLNLRP